MRSRVTNVADYLPHQITLPEFRQILLHNIVRENPGQAYPLTQEDLAGVDKLRDQRYALWEWNYGLSPECTLLRRRRVEGCGMVEAYIAVEHGLISNINFRGDFFGAIEPEELAKQFIGSRPSRDGYAAVLEGVDASHCFMGLNNETLLDILCG